MLTSELSLRNFNSDLEKVLASAVNDYGIKAVICHEFKDGKINAVAHASRTLIAADKNYCQIEKEALSIILAEKKFHHIIGKLFCKKITNHYWLILVLK